MGFGSLRREDQEQAPYVRHPVTPLQVDPAPEQPAPLERLQMCRQVPAKQP